MVRACCELILHRRARKQRQVIEPAALPPNAVLYRNDGAARGQGHGHAQSGDVRSGVGAIYYASDVSVQGWMCVSLGSVSNNVAEYIGAIAVLARVQRMSDAFVVLQMDSMLVVNQCAC